MRKLINGIVDFRKKSLAEYRSKYSKLALRQSPDALFVACCDSRVVPNTFASSDPGDLFVLRNIGNLIPPCCDGHDIHKTDVSCAATIEFSLVSLGVSDIVICGHSDCGAMQALLDNSPNLGKTLPNLDCWLEHAKPTYERYEKTPTFGSALSACNVLSQINVLQQLDNLKTYPLVREQLASNKLQIHGWWFDLATADVYCYNQKLQKFVLIEG